MCPSLYRRHRKKQLNIIDDKKSEIVSRMREQGVLAARGGKDGAKKEGDKGKGEGKGKEAAGAKGGEGPAEIPKALARLYKK